jgi:glycerophosphoryl diester phosphodiesterase
MSTPSWLVAKPIAHRGLHNKTQGIIENTLAAAEAAIEYDFPIECDVQLTADGEAVVFHDFDLARLTDAQGLIVERKLADLTSIGITGSTKGDKIPSLQGFLSQIAKRVPLVIEIKSKFDGDLRLTRRVCEIMADYHGPFVIKSFDPVIVEALRTLAPQVTRGIIGELHYASKADSNLSADLKHRLANLLHFNESQPQFISWKVHDLPCAAPFLSRALGNLPVMAWTVRNPDERARAEKHADQMVFEGFMP